MKQIFTLVIAGMVGGLTFWGVSEVNKGSADSVVYNQSPSARLVSANNFTATSQPFDFVKASEQATEVVVHIVAEESLDSARKRQEESRRSRRSPFDDFFGGDIFGQDFFGQDYFRGGGQKNGSGSGVIFSRDGYIVTNNHVVGFADKILVTLEDGREVNATKIGTDPSTDLAVIKIDVDGNLPTLDFADSDDVKVGEWVLAVGNPFNYLTSTVTAGIISAKGRDLDIISEDKSIEEFLQTDAVVNPGNSGGALVNTDGQLLGINTAIATPTGVYAGYSFAIPSNLVKRIVYEIIENGDIERVNLGVQGYDVDNEIQEDFQLDKDYGFYIAKIDKGSAAQFSGLLPGDVVIGINNVTVARFEDIVQEMKYNKAGDTVMITVMRDDQKKDIKVRLRKGL